MTLAFYDLCAVLTPCGPLKALVEMAQSRNDGIPGLLYEAQVEEAEEEDSPSARPSRPVVSSSLESGNVNHPQNYLVLLPIRSRYQR